MGGGGVNIRGVPACVGGGGALGPGLRDCVLSRFAFDAAMIADAGSSSLVSHVKLLLQSLISNQQAINLTSASVYHAY